MQDCSDMPRPSRSGESSTFPSFSIKMVKVVVLSLPSVQLLLSIPWLVLHETGEPRRRPFRYA